MLGRSWKVYVFPPSVIVGSEIARSGTSWMPCAPPTFRKPTSPSFVIVKADQLDAVYTTAGSTKSSSSVRTSSWPPRCSAPLEPTAT
jgi:hypothetical protein